MQYRDIAMQQRAYRLAVRILARRIEVKKSYLSIAAAVLSIAGATAGFAAELPTYETNGLPISAAQVAVLGVAPRPLSIWQTFLFASILFHHSKPAPSAVA